MKQIFIGLSILVILLFPFQPKVVQAETQYDLNDFKEYDSFMKRYHEHSTELMYLMSVSYGSNEHYFRENMQLFRDAVSQVYDIEKDGFVDNYLQSAENLFSKPVALYGVLKDLKTEIFSKIKNFFSRDDYNSGVTVSGTSIYPPPGYHFALEGFNQENDKFTAISFLNNVLRIRALRVDGTLYATLYTANNAVPAHDEALNDLGPKVSSGSINVSDYYRHQSVLGLPSLYLVSNDTLDRSPVQTSGVPPSIGNVFNNIIDSGYDYPQDYTPTVQPTLVCPSFNVNLDFADGVFKTSEGLPLTLNNESAVYNGENCNLDFTFPEIVYHEPTNKLLVGDNDLSPISNGVDAGYDLTIVEYIRNSYNYATSVISSGVNGLKSIVSGSAGLVTFSSSLFGFLPPELLTLFIGGFSIALGLWVFKK